MYWLYNVMFYLAWVSGFASLAIGCILVRRNWPVYARSLFILLISILLIEILGLSWSIIMHRSNHWIFNLYMPVYCCGYLYCFYRASVHRVVRRLDGWLLVAVLPGIVIAYTLNPVFYFVNTYAFIFYHFLRLLASIGAYVDLLLDQRPVRLAREPLFWLAGGVLLDSIFSIVYFAFWVYSMKMILFSFFVLACFGASVFQYLGMATTFVALHRAETRKVR